MDVINYLFEADGTSKQIELPEVEVGKLNDRQLLWINVLKRDKTLLGQIIEKLNLEKVPVDVVTAPTKRPKINRYGNFYHFFVVTVSKKDGEKIKPIPIDYIVGENFVVTVHDSDVGYFQEFIAQDEGETHLGELDAESFVATMLDLHIASYFRVLEIIEKEVDEMDEEILKKDLEDEEFLERMVKLRGDVSKLRRWFLPHRDVYYALSRPDFKEISDSDSFENFKLLDEHFESAVDAIESARDTVLSLFDLYTTKTSHRMNNLMKRLTFITLMVGTMGVIAGILGMNFEEEFFKSPQAFWFVIAGMFLFTIGITVFAWRKSWF